MSTSILTTKLYAPQSYTDLVSRPRLIERLDNASSARLILVSAPAGFGKTTLIGKWTASSARTFSWLSLDEADNDLARFWAYAIRALQTAHPEVGQMALAALDANGKAWTHETIEPALTALINDLASSAVPPTTLVLDDYHLVDQPDIHSTLRFFIEHLPSAVNVLVSTRVDPPLPLSRWRVRRQLLELRQADLCFTLEEASAFFNRVMRLQVDTADVATLDQRTEGWIAGLQMAALSLQGRGDVSLFVQDFAGSNRYVLDYLMEEVLDREPEPVRTFLLRTSILDRLSGPLCAAVCDCEANDGQEMLEYLEANNLFVVSLDQSRQWYRYHRLFADLLSSRLRRMPAEPLSTLYLRASGWCKENKDVAGAIDYALKAQDVDRAAELIEEEVLSHGLAPLHWIEALPAETVLDHPVLAASQVIMRFVSAQAMTLSLQDHLDRIAIRVESAPVSEMSDGYHRLAKGYLAWANGFVALIQDDYQQAASLVRQTLHSFPAEATMMRSLGLLLLGQAYAGLEQSEPCNRAFRQAHELAIECGALSRAMMALTQLTIALIRQGKLRETAEILEEALATYAPGDRYAVPEVSGLALNLGNVWVQQNQLDQAEALIQQGLTWANLTAQSAIKRGCWFWLMHIRRMRRDWEGARAAWDELAAVMSLQPEYCQALAIELDAWRVLAEPHRAPELARRVTEYGLDLILDDSVHGQLPAYGFEYHRCLALVRATVAFVRIGGDTIDLVSVHHFLRHQIAVKMARGWNGNAIELLVMQAMAFEVEGQIDCALASLERALVLAEPEGYVRVFVDQGAPMIALLRQAAAGGIVPSYVGDLLSVCVSQEQSGRTSQGLIEPLSERELQVLRLVAAGLSNREIAEQLYLAVGTVKKHLNNIYGKLGVQRRTKAVARAQTLDLV